MMAPSPPIAIVWSGSWRAALTAGELRWTRRRRRRSSRGSRLCHTELFVSASLRATASASASHSSRSSCRPSTRPAWRRRRSRRSSCRASRSCPETDASLRLSWRLDAVAAAARRAEPVEYAVELCSRSTRRWAEQSRVKHTSSSDEQSLSGWRPKAPADESLVRVVPIFAKGRLGLATLVDLPLPATQALVASTPLVERPSADAHRRSRDVRSLQVS